MSVLLLLLAMESGRTFQPLPAEGDEYLALPAAFAFAPDGRLYLVDANTSRVHVWGQGGNYLKSFGKKGEGPGEYTVPMAIDIAAGNLWILDSRGVMTRLDMDGNYLSSSRMVKPRLRVMAAIDSDNFLITARYQETPTVIYNHIELVDPSGEIKQTMQKWQNESFTTPREDYDKAMVKAFPPACEIQRGADGRWYFGFGQSNSLHLVDKSGKLVEKRRFQLPSEEVTDEEKAWWPDLTLPCWGGQNFTFKDWPSIRTDFSHDKAYFTRFVIKEDRAIFLLTPDGGIMSCEGFPGGNWFICDLKTGKLLDRGRFLYPEGSLVYTRHDRILGLLMNEDDEYEIRELDFPAK